jgi:hypothetical protein
MQTTGVKLIMKYHPEQQIETLITVALIPQDHKNKERLNGKWENERNSMKTIEMENKTITFSAE